MCYNAGKQRSFMKANKAVRSQDACTITISCTKALRTQIDEAAKAERRNRSNFIVYELEKACDRVLKGSTHNPCPASGCGQKTDKAS